MTDTVNITINASALLAKLRRTSTGRLVYRPIELHKTRDHMVLLLYHTSIHKLLKLTLEQNIRITLIVKIEISLLEKKEIEIHNVILVQPFI